jgi:hypothetical protein
VIHNQCQKVVNVLPPVAIVDNASWTTNVIDTLGWDYCTIYFCLGANDIAIAALKVQEADAAASATALTNGADVTGLVFGTSTNIAGSTSALPADDEDGNVFAFDIDLKGRKRYLDLVATNGDGTAGGFASAFAVLSRGEQAPVTAAQRGCVEILRV